MEAIEEFPKRADNIYTERGKAVLVKTDIFKGLMYYTYIVDGQRGKFYALSLKRVKEIIALNKQDKKPADLMSMEDYLAAETAASSKNDYESVNEVIELPPEERKKRNKRRNNKNRKKGPRQGQGQKNQKNSSGNNNKKENSGQKAKDGKPENNKGKRPPKKKKYFKRKPKSGAPPKKD